MAKPQKEKNSALMKENIKHWTLYIDDTSNDTRSRAVIMLISLEGHKIHCALCFEFKALNTEAESKSL